MMTKMKATVNKYWPVFLVGAYFALTCLYNGIGENGSVFWNTFIKTIRELFLIVFIYKSLAVQNNTISMTFSVVAISMSLGYMLFRFYCAFMSAGDYTIYMSYMKDNDNRLIMSIIIFIILVAIKFLKRKHYV